MFDKSVCVGTEILCCGLE